ncbi:MAG: tail fiber protein [Caenispirillum bisanense]|nr:tail fiber protein [Caenispirillum bisanense]MCA1971212.1 tail fiber protein [Caenispirillum sp.]
MDPFIGEIRVFPYWFTPHGWLQCNGQILNISQYQALYALLGTKFGGNGTTTFALPNMQGRSAICTDYATTYPVGATGGEATHQLTIAEVPAHTHSLSAVDVAGSTNVAGTGVMVGQSMNSSRSPAPFNAFGAGPGNAQMGTGALAMAGTSQGHENMQPYLVLNYCIASTGLWPPQPW